MEKVNLRSFYSRLFAVVIIGCLGAIIYFNTLLCSFHLDDFRFISDNPAIRNLWDLHDIWKFYPCRSVVFFSFALNYHLNGLDVFGYHLFNLAVHIASAILVWQLTLLTLATPAMKDSKISQDADLIALFTGLVFVSHPLQTEAVTYIWQRSASMAALFYLASLCLYVRSRLLQFTEPSSIRIRIYYICSLITAVAAMFTKENAITLPLMILLYEASFLRIKKGLDWKHFAPFLLTLLIIPVTIFLTEQNRAQEIRGVTQGPGGIAPTDYLLTQFRVMATYIRSIFLPFNQNLDYDFPISRSILEMPTLLSFLFLAGILFFAKRMFFRFRFVSFSIFWFFLTLLPESSFLPLRDVIFEHRLYLPMAGVSMFLVSGAYYLWGKNSLKLLGVVLTLIITSYSVLTFQRNKVWKNEITLWEDTVPKSPHKARPYSNLGSAYLWQDHFFQAQIEFNKAIELDPNFGLAYRGRGVSYMRQGKFSQAVLDLNRAIKIDPDDTLALWGRAAAYYNLKEFDKARSDVQKIEEIGTPLDLERISKLVKALSGHP